MQKEKKELGGWWMWILLFMVISGIVLTTMGYMGKFAGTVVERKVFENSYQRSEAMRSRENAYQAQLAQINAQIMSTTNQDMLTNLRTQKAMLEVQISQTKGMK